MSVRTAAGDAILGETGDGCTEWADTSLSSSHTRPPHPENTGISPLWHTVHILRNTQQPQPGIIRVCIPILPFNKAYEQLLALPYGTRPIYRLKGFLPSSRNSIRQLSLYAAHSRCTSVFACSTIHIDVFVSCYSSKAKKESLLSSQEYTPVYYPCISHYSRKNVVNILVGLSITKSVSLLSDLQTASLPHVSYCPSFSLLFLREPLLGLVPVEALCLLFLLFGCSRLEALTS